MSLALRILLVSAALASTLPLAACGGSSETSKKAGGSSASGSGTSNAQDTARVKLTQCLREQGIDVPDTAQTGDAFAQLSPAERQRAQTAMQGPCRKYQSDAFGDTHDPQSQEFVDALTSFTACLRKNGADVPDPDPNDPFSVLHSLDQSDPTIAAALWACQDRLAALNGGG